MESIPLVPELLEVIVTLDIGHGETLLRVRPVLLLVCKEWNSVVQRIRKRPRLFCLFELAERNYVSIITWRREQWAACWKASNANQILGGAILGGHEELCRLAKGWGATNFDLMLWYAAHGGHESLCRLAKEWGATGFDLMLASAACSGHEGVCQLAKEWGATDENAFPTRYRMSIQ
jgi:hypothetical protein